MYQPDIIKLYAITKKEGTEMPEIVKCSFFSNFDHNIVKFDVKVKKDEGIY